MATETVDPYALTDENRAARAKACEAIKAFKAISAKLPKRQTKRQQILAANKAESTAFVKPITVQAETAIEDESILW